MIIVLQEHLQSMEHVNNVNLVAKFVPTKQILVTFVKVISFLNLMVHVLIIPQFQIVLQDNT